MAVAIKVLQFNVDRGRIAHDLMEAMAQEEGIDIILTAEPYLARVANNDDWIKDTHNLAAIKVRNRGLKVTRVEKGKGFVAVTIHQIATVYAYYVSPNSTGDEYEQFIQSLDDSITRNPGPTILGGDINGKSLLWGCQKEDARGRVAAEWIESRDLVVANEGNTPTFERCNCSSILDVTLTTPDLASRIHNWRVHEEETVSCHKFITFQLNHPDREERPKRQRAEFRGWVIKKMDVEAFDEEWQKLTAQKTTKTPEELTELLTKCCNASMPKRRTGRKRQPVYWWNSEIAEQRKACLAARRTAQRKKNVDERRAAQDDYRQEKRKLKKLIEKSKNDSWQRVCVEVEQDVWGLGYKIVMKKLKRDITTLDIEEKRVEYHKLFPTHQGIRWTVPVVSDRVPPFTADELKEAVKKMTSGKAPGLDMIPAEAVKLAASIDPETILRVMNGALEAGVFPEQWKVSKLVLIPKGKKAPGVQTAYRPICLLDVTGKMLERLIAKRLVKAIEDSGDLSPSQYGFRKGRRTTDAMKEVLQVALDEKAKDWRKKELCALVLLDIKNAFNSVSWIRIVRELRRRKIPWYLIRIIQSYLEKRRTELEKGETEDTSAGVPQGSVLGPLLWNIFYDGVLRLDLPLGVKLVAFADDLAVVATAPTEDLLEKRVNETLARIKRWMDGHDIELAPHKTEAVLLIGEKKLRRQVTFRVGDHEVIPLPKVKYLGVIFDGKLRFGEHIKHVSEKAKKCAMAITGLMPKFGGASDNKRRILAGVMDSIILYGPEVWKEALKVHRYRQMIVTLERRVALRICSAYRTTSTEALRVIGRRIPLVLLADERTSNEADKREVTLEKWQERWDVAAEGRWTYRLIPFVKPWYNREYGWTNRYLTQFLSGHGCFRAYLHRFKIIPDDTCLYCGEANDDAEHAVFNCEYFEKNRERLSEAGRSSFTPDQVIEYMLDSQEKWNEMANVICSIVKEKEQEDRGAANESQPSINH